jgi:glycosyltransferase involved in cell wall biosynthesis
VTKVVIVVCKLDQLALTEALTHFRTRDTDVTVVCNFDVSELSVEAALATIHPLPMTYADLSKAAGRTTGSRRVWLKIRDDGWVRERARQADLLVALDTTSVYAVWELAKRYPRPAAVHGLAPALRALDEGLGTRESRSAEALHAIRDRGGIALRGARNASVFAVKRSVRAAVSPAVMRTGVGSAVWSRLVALPSIPDRVRVKMAQIVTKSMAQAGRPADSSRTALRATMHIHNVRRKADLLAAVARREALTGEVQALRAAIGVELGIADEHYANGSFRAAAASLRRAMSLVFRRTIHYDRVEVSPLVKDPAGFLSAWRRSTVVQALHAPRGRAVPAAPRPTDRPLRLLIATSGNDNFVTEIRRHYEQMPGVETRFLNFRDDKRRYALSTDTATMLEYILSGRSAYGAHVQEWLEPYVEWADTIFIDWCVAGAVMFTLLDPATTRVIVRLHSYETFAFWPHLVDFTRVDDLVFVSEHLCDITTAVLPQLAAAGTRLHVISNAMDLLAYPREKSPDARFTLGLVGVGSVAKDPRWAVEVARLLRQRDDRYRLLLFGDEVEAELSAASRAYYRSLADDLSDLEPSGAVVRLGQVHDIPAALVDVGVILSTSVRESFHCALVEGAASGAVPVVRNWPFFAATTHGAHTLFPPDWVVETPAAAADRIWAVTQSEEIWRETGRDASLLAIKQWDWTVTQRSFDELFLGAVAVELPSRPE